MHKMAWTSFLANYAAAVQNYPVTQTATGHQCHYEEFSHWYTLTSPVEAGLRDDSGDF